MFQKMSIRGRIISLAVVLMLSLVIGFGIFGTVIMMINERRREMGIVIAIGMQRYKLEAVLFFETILIGIVGVIIGFIISIPLINYFYFNPIPLPAETAEAYEQFGMEAVMFFSRELKVFVRQTIIVFLLTSVISLYPAIKTSKLRLTSAIKGQ